MSDRAWDDLASVTSKIGSNSFVVLGSFVAAICSGDDGAMNSEIKRMHEIRKILDDVHEGAFKENQSPEAELVYDSFAWSVGSGYRLEKKEFANELEDGMFSDGIIKFLNGMSEDWGSVDTNELICGVQGVMQYGGKRYIGDYLELFGRKEEGNLDRANRVKMAANYYVKHCGLKRGNIEGFEEMIKLEKRNDPEIVGIARDFPRFREGRFGIETYTIECFSAKNTPAEIDRLVRIHNEIPTTDFGKREQNRKDAIILERGLIRDRSFIHDEDPGVHEILKAMMEYYDSWCNRGDFLQKKDELKKIEEKYWRYALGKDIYDIRQYEGYDEYGERQIDALRRLVENTEPIPLEVPKTKFETLNQKLLKVGSVLNERGGGTRVDIGEVGVAVKEMNRILLEKQGEIGVYPSMVNAITYLDKMSVYALKDLSRKKLAEMAFDDGFKEIVRFSQLTSSLGYDEREFERVFGKFKDKMTEGYSKLEDVVDMDKVQDSYRILGSAIRNNVRDLAKEYGKNEYTERFVGAVWSGNLSRELMRLFDKI